MCYGLTTTECRWLAGKGENTCAEKGTSATTCCTISGTGNSVLPVKYSASSF